MTLRDEMIEIQRAGSNAKARGESLLDNPYLKASALPGQSGDSPEVWEAKHANWELGYRAEELMRPNLGHSISTQGEERGG